MRKALLAASLAAGAAGLAACGGSPVTASRLNTAVGKTFTNLYATQQREIGNPVDTAAYSTASCQRSSGDTTGAGDDWVCAVTIYRKTGLPVIATVEVKVKTNGCFVADSPLAVVGQPQLTAPDGSTITNPLTEFDGCFDTW